MSEIPEIHKILYFDKTTGNLYNVMFDKDLKPINFKYREDGSGIILNNPLQEPCGKASDKDVVVMLNPDIITGGYPFEKLGAWTENKQPITEAQTPEPKKKSRAKKKP